MSFLFFFFGCVLSNEIPKFYDSKLDVSKLQIPGKAKLPPVFVEIYWNTVMLCICVSSTRSSYSDGKVE